MWLRIAAHYPVEYIAEVLARYRSHAEIMAQTEDIWIVHQSRAVAIDRAVTLAPVVYGPVRAQAMAALCLFTGRQLALVGDHDEARHMFAQAIRWRPVLFSAYSHWLLSWLGPAKLKKATRMLRRLRNHWYRAQVTRLVKPEHK